MIAFQLALIYYPLIIFMNNNNAQLFRTIKSNTPTG